MSESFNQQFNSYQKEKNRNRENDRIQVQDVFLLFVFKFSNMTLKLFRAMWFLSVLVVLANLLYVYASLPEEVIVQENERLFVNREWLFYILMMSIVLINMLVYLFKLMFQNGEDIRSWFHGLVITINIFIIISMQALSVYNSSEIFNHSIVGIYLTGSLVLVLLWALSWPVYLLLQKFFLKEAI
jgi:hypothetical protein